MTKKKKTICITRDQSLLKKPLYLLNTEPATTGPAAVKTPFSLPALAGKFLTDSYLQFGIWELPPFITLRDKQDLRQALTEERTLVDVIYKGDI